MKSALTLCLLMALGSPAAGQLSVKVVDADGRPIPSVEVEVYGRGELLEVRATGGDGTVELDEDRWSEVRRLSLRHAGYQTLIVQAEDVRPGAVFSLGARAIAIEGLAVDGTPLCPAADDPRARALWESVAKRYADDTGIRPLSLRFTVRRDGALAGEVRQWIEPGPTVYIMGAGPRGVHGGDPASRTVDDRIVDEGYAWPPTLIGGMGSPRYIAWEYPELHSRDAHHFASAAFASLHDLQIVSETEEETVLGFCPTGGGNLGVMRGTLTVLADTAFVRADWLIETPEPDEGAGGSVHFTAWHEGGAGRPHLMAARGTYYRHSGVEPPYPDLPRSYSRETIRHLRWFVHGPGEHPCESPGGGRVGYSIFGERSTDATGRAFVTCIRGFTGDDEQLIREARERSNAAIAAHDIGAILAEVDSAFQITAGSGRLLQGRAAMGEAFAAQFADFPDTRYVRTAESVEVADSGSLAFETGSWVGTWTTPAGPFRTGGRYSASWSRASGMWKIRSELFVTLFCEGSGCSDGGR